MWEFKTNKEKEWTTERRYGGRLSSKGPPVLQANLPGLRCKTKTQRSGKKKMSKEGMGREVRSRMKERILRIPEIAITSISKSNLSCFLERL